MHAFLLRHRDELITRCKAKVAARPRRDATTAQLANGVPLFLSQLTRTLQAEEDGEDAESILISGPAGGDVTALSEIGVSATAHGKQLLQLGYSANQASTITAISAKRSPTWRSSSTRRSRSTSSAP